MSPQCSRKSFLAKLGGVLAAVGIAPALIAKIGASPVALTLATTAPVTLRPEGRAVVRREGSC